MHWQAAAIYGFTNQAMARRQSTFAQSATKLNPICSTISRNEARIDILGT
ncbi:hypothetical protein GCM10011585_24080 [Edaphobacter dinghuensis]|uniref:Uncharacterized protein n=1 Tax=Edaphobacter dinghuensis TaxID=1560005 RepID=A0A917HJ93_9BACT|nr:hypothetical protein GCM10011585_24080 [Edaphobacter dinghuensis]